MNARGLLMTSGITCAAVATVIAADRRISRADYGDRWPFTVSEGVLSCVVVGNLGTTVVQAVYFRVGATMYPINGIAKGRGGPAMEAIWKTYPAKEPKIVLTRLPESKRRDLYLTVVACPAQAERAADQKFPNATTPSEIKSWGVYDGKMIEQCRLQTRAKDKLTEHELYLIEDEGHVRQWAVISHPPRVDIGPIIDDGLKLCSR